MRNSKLVFSNWSLVIILPTFYGYMYNIAKIENLSTPTPIFLLQAERLRLKL